MNRTNWTIENIKDLSGKFIIVTGANSGLGLEATKIFSSKGANVIMACRSEEKALDAKQIIENQNKNAKIEFMKLDLGSLLSIKEFVATYKSKYSKIDVLLNNAGIMTVPYGKTMDGFELQNGVNHLGHFALTSQLFDIIKNTPKSRIVNVSSSAHKAGKMDFDNYLFDKGSYGKLKSYSRSKLSNLLFTYELDRRIRKQGYDIEVLAAHPGGANTDLGRYIETGKLLKPIVWLAYKLTQTAYAGSLPLVRASLDKSAQSGEYYGPGGFAGMRGKPVHVKSNKRSHNLEDAITLWHLSEKLTKETFKV